MSQTGRLELGAAVVPIGIPSGCATGAGVLLAGMEGTLAPPDSNVWREKLGFNGVDADPPVEAGT